MENKALQKPKKKGNTNLKQRLLSAIILGPLLLLLVKGGNWTFLVLILGISARSAWEWCVICRNAGYKPNHFLSILTAMGLVFCVHSAGISLLYLYICIATILLFAISLINGTKNYLSNAVMGIGTMMYAGILGSTPLAIVRYVGEQNSSYNLIIALFFCIWLTDSFAYFFGRKWGKRTFAPEISPNKTVVGVLGGIIGSVVPMIFFPYLPGLAPAVLLGMFMVAGIAGQVGDLVESAMKRDMGNIKDSPALIPGHGGMLDRFDSYFFAFPVAYIYLEIIAIFGF